jgi:hypothetical protein
MARVFSYFVHPNFERDAFLRYGKPLGKEEIISAADSIESAISSPQAVFSGAASLRNLTRTT